METQAYDPMEYWNEREHPNTQENPAVSPNEERLLSPFLSKANSLLEIGPGIGRLLPLYVDVPRVVTVDLSQKYKERIETLAASLRIDVESHYIDSALAPLPFRDGEFDVGVVAFVFIHVPFENIVHSMSEAARCCKNVVVLSTVHRYWPKLGAEYDPKWHCFNHDYEALCKTIGLNYCGYEKFSESPDVVNFGFVFSRSR
jgi:SAM-dependent methyltransferase